MSFARLACGHISPDKTPELTITDALIPATQTLPGRCVDGRLPLDMQLALPCLPGAFLSPALAHAATSGLDLEAASSEVASAMAADGHEVLIHTGEVPGRGCGAIDSLPDILNITTSEDLASAAADLHLPEPRAVSIAGRATGLYDSVKAQALRGGHAEQAIVINRRPDTTVDRTAFAEEVFWVDAWAIDEIANYLSARFGDDPREIRAILSGFTTATMAALCAPEMPVLIEPRD